MILKNCKAVMFLLGLISPTVGLGLPNPASQYCVENGGTVQIAKRGDGGEYGICIFTDNRQCEEWAMFRGECLRGGVKVTGFLTPEGTYCAIRGGKVLENETLCQLPSGKICSTRDLYGILLKNDKLRQTPLQKLHNDH